MINVLIPMAGLGTRFSNQGYVKPKPFIDVAGKPMIVKVIENLNIPNARFILIARKEHIEAELELVRFIEKNYNAIFIPISLVTEGAACTTLFAQYLINNDSPLMIANSDQLVDIATIDFIRDCDDRKLDGSILTFFSNETKWSYAELDADSLVKLVKEKEVISNHATVGIYYFSKGSNYVSNAIDMIIRNDRVKNEFYVCPVYNYLIEKGLKIGIFEINDSQMHGIGTPEDLNKYLEHKNGKI